MTYDNRNTLRTVTIGAFWRLLRFPFLFLSITVIPRAMGKELYGQLAYFTAILTMSEAFTGLGNMQIFGRFGPEVRQDPAREARLLHGILLYGTLAVALFTGGMSLFFLTLKPDAFPLRWLPMLAVIILTSKIQGTVFAFLYGRNEIGRFSARELLRSALTFVLTLGLFAWTGSLEGALWALALSSLLLMLLALWWGRDALFRRWERLPFREFRPYFLFGATFYLPTILLFFLQRAAPLFIRGLTGGYTHVASFDVANQFLMTTGMFLGLIFTTLVPALSRLHADNRQDEMLNWNRTALAWCGALAFLAFIALVWCGRPLIRLALGAEFDDLYPVAVAIGLAFAPMLAAQMGLNYSIVRKKPSVYAASTVFGALAMVGGCLVLVPRADALGAAWATVAAQSAVALVYAAFFKGEFLAVLRDFGAVAGLGLLVALPGLLVTPRLPLAVGAALLAGALYLAALAALRILRPADVAAVLRSLRRR